MPRTAVATPPRPRRPSTSCLTEGEHRVTFLSPSCVMRSPRPGSARRGPFDPARTHRGRCEPGRRERARPAAPQSPLSRPPPRAATASPRPRREEDAEPAQGRGRPQDLRVGRDASQPERGPPRRRRGRAPPSTWTTSPSVMGDSVHTYLKSIGRRTLLTAAQEVELAKRIEAGLYAEYKLETEPGLSADRPRRPGVGGRGRQGGQGPHAGGQPPAGRLGRQEVHRPRHVPARRGPGGQPRPDQRRGEVRLHQGLQVLHLRHVVDQAGHPARLRRLRPHHPPARARAGDAVQAVAHRARHAPAPGPGAHARGAGGRAGQDAPTRSRNCCAPAASRSA